jgi:transglutaminase-like putative cysteine protease
MKLRIEHVTSFAYNEPISEAYTELRLHPLDTVTQRCLSFKLITEPRGEVMHYSDRFGNMVHHFDALASHQQVVVRSASEVLTGDTFADDQRELSPLDEFDYLAPTKYAQHDPSVVEFTKPHIVAGDSNATALQLMNVLFTSMKYEHGATDVSTTATEALLLHRGVCQDFAHVMLAASRSAGIPARYVSGYLYSATHEANEASNAASHAWVDVFTKERGWVSMDPTHGCEQTNHYVRVAVGRDYADVPPTRGVFKGKAKESLSVQVKVSAA